MTTSELKQYILTNQNDREAWEKFNSKPKSKAVITIPPNTPIEETERILRELIQNQKS
jgi:hypothetical protein